MSSVGSKSIWLLACVAAVSAIVVVWMLATPEPFRLIVLFDEVGTLKKGDPVVWREFQVGKVEEIQPLVDNHVGVTIRIKDEYAAKITHGTEFVLKQAALLGFVGKSGIELVTPEEPGTPFARLEKVSGKIPERDSVVAKAKELTAEYWRQLKEQTTVAMHEFKSSRRGREILEILGELESLASQGARQAQGSLDRFERDHRDQIDSLILKLEQIRDEMRKRGETEPAERIDQEIGKFRKAKR